MTSVDRASVDSVQPICKINDQEVIFPTIRFGEAFGLSGYIEIEMQPDCYKVKCIAIDKLQEIVQELSNKYLKKIWAINLANCQIELRDGSAVRFTTQTDTLSSKEAQSSEGLKKFLRNSARTIVKPLMYDCALAKTSLTGNAVFVSKQQKIFEERAAIQIEQEAREKAEKEKLEALKQEAIDSAEELQAIASKARAWAASLETRQVVDEPPRPPTSKKPMEQSAGERSEWEAELKDGLAIITCSMAACGIKMPSPKAKKPSPPAGKNTPS